MNQSSTKPPVSAAAAINADAMPNRLSAVDGEWIGRHHTISFQFEGKTYFAYPGDTISSALWAAGQRTLGRSFKYHRRRGVLSLANHDVNAMLQHGDMPNVRADITPVEDGMRLTAVNTFGGLESDRARLLDRLSRFLPVGFYYKAFHTPRRFFPKWEEMFRTMTGLGELKFDAPRIKTPKRYDFTDVLVIGAGAAGLSAALAAARAGARVVVVDENPQVGGALAYNRAGKKDSLELLAKLLAAIAAMPTIELRAGTVASGYYADHWIPLVDSTRMTKMRARSVVVASGVFEQPAVFRNNDLPGIMLASAAQRLMYRYGVRPMQMAVVLTANADGYRAAFDLHSHGIGVAAIVDMTNADLVQPLVTLAGSMGIQVLKNSCVYEARATASNDGVRSVIVAGMGAPGQAASDRQEIACDGVLMSVGYAPAAALLYQAGTRMRYSEQVHQFVPETLPDGVFAAGRVNGVYHLENRLSDGERAGSAAANYLGFAPGHQPAALVPEEGSPSHPYPIIAHPKGKNFVDFDEDISVKDYANAAQEGFDNIELMKRFTTSGMGPSQGKHSNMNAIRILASITGQAIGDVGSTTARPFFHPVAFSHLAGRSFAVERFTPLHARHTAANAVFMQAGVWLRPEYYAVTGRERVQVIQDEVASVRNQVGLIDVGTLGKLEVYGPDAAEFLERMYTGKFSNLKVGMTRYGVMVDEAGVVIDDGVIARLSDEQFYFTTTTTGSATVYREMTRLNTQWRLKVGIVNVTGAYSGMNLAGPKSREILATLADFDVSDAAFPYLAVREGNVCGVPARLMRVGFVGELGYEIHVRADCAAHLWDGLMKAGNPHGIRPFGVEAQRLLRLEKGHIIVSQDTDGLTSPFEAAMGWAVKLDKAFFVGQRSLKILDKQGPRQMLVGFVSEAASDPVVLKESHLVINEGNISGRITSVAHSRTLGKRIGLAFVSPSLAAVGTRIRIRGENGVMADAEVVKLPFYDAEGARQKI